MSEPETPAPSAIPEDLGLPFFGHSLAYLRDPTGNLRERHDRLGEISVARMLGMRWLVMLGPDALQTVLQNREEAYASSGWELLIGKLFHRGLMLLDGDEHRLHRRIMQAAFAREALAAYLEPMSARIDHDLGAWRAGLDFRFFDHIKRLTLNVGAEVFAGAAPGAAAERLNRAFLDTVQAAGALLRLPLPGTRWWRGLRGRRLLERHFAADIASKRRAPGADMVSRLCQARGDGGELFSDEDIVNHTIFLLMAAHDTSAISLTGIVYFLARHSEWQQRLRAEAEALPARPDLAALDGMADAGLVLRETLRLIAPVPTLLRKVVKPTRFKGHRLEPGDKLFVSPWQVHHMREHWSEPERFDPERFSAARAEDRRHPFLWAPFGGGAHKCIGLHFGEMEVKLILHRLLRRFEWSVADGYTMPLNMVSLPIPKDGLPIRLVERR